MGKQITKATIVADEHDISIFLSGVMLLEREILGFINMAPIQREQLPGTPNKEQLDESLALCREKRKMLEDVLTSLEIENAKGNMKIT
jgi:hypothetical protein